MKPKFALEYILFTLFLITFFCILFIFEVLQRIANLFGRQTVELTQYLFNKSILLSLKITGAKFNFTYEEVPKNEGPLIIISNHQSMFDIPCLFLAYKNLAPRFVSKKELASKIPGVSTCLKVTKAAIIDRKDPSQALPEIKRFANFIKEIKKSAVIFPEGTRARDGTVKQFKKKGSLLLINQCLPCWVTPITIDGSWHFQRRKYGPIPLGTNVQIHSGKSIFVTNREEAEKAIELAELEINNNLINFRAK